MPCPYRRVGGFAPAGIWWLCRRVERQGRMRQPSERVRRLALLSWVLVACVVLPIAGVEAGIELILRYPQMWPGLFRPANRLTPAKNYYMGFDRSIIQFRPDCAMYDDALIYRLRPGTCTVRN